MPAPVALVRAEVVVKPDEVEVNGSKAFDDFVLPIVECPCDEPACAKRGGDPEQERTPHDETAAGRRRDGGAVGGVEEALEVGKVANGEHLIPW